MDFEKFLSRKKISASAVAKTLGVSDASVSQWRSGKNPPSYKTCVELLRLGMRIDELFDSEIWEQIKTDCAPEFRDAVMLSPEECARIVRSGLDALRSGGK